MLSDSTESGSQNWTDTMLAEFRSRRGYDALPWLPTLAGAVIGGVEASDRFLWDFRRAIAELLVENHYGVLARTAREQRLTYYAEALEDQRPQLGDDMEMRCHADIPMGAMWTLPKGGQPKSTYPDTGRSRRNAVPPPTVRMPNCCLPVFWDRYNC